MLYQMKNNKLEEIFLLTEQKIYVDLDLINFSSLKYIKNCFKEDRYTNGKVIDVVNWVSLSNSGTMLNDLFKFKNLLNYLYNKKQSIWFIFKLKSFFYFFIKRKKFLLTREIKKMNESSLKLEDLPNEILDKIITYLDKKNTLYINKRFYNLTKSKIYNFITVNLAKDINLNELYSFNHEYLKIIYDECTTTASEEYSESNETDELGATEPQRGTACKVNTSKIAGVKRSYTKSTSEANEASEASEACTSGEAGAASEAGTSGVASVEKICLEEIEKNLIENRIRKLTVFENVKTIYIELNIKEKKKFLDRFVIKNLNLNEFIMLKVFNILVSNKSKPIKNFYVDLKGGNIDYQLVFINQFFLKYFEKNQFSNLERFIFNGNENFYILLSNDFFILSDIKSNCFVKDLIYNMSSDKIEFIYLILVSQIYFLEPIKNLKNLKYINTVYRKDFFLNSDKIDILNDYEITTYRNIEFNDVYYFKNILKDEFDKSSLSDLFFKK